MSIAVRVVADLIDSKQRFSFPGGHQTITERCATMRASLEQNLRQLALGVPVSITPLEPLGDDAGFELVGESVTRLASLAVRTVITSFATSKVGREFRYTVFTLHTAGAYHPRIKEIEGISKTDEGRAYYIALDRSLVPFVDQELAAWLRAVSHTELHLPLKGEPHTGIIFDLYCMRSENRKYRVPSRPGRDELAERTYLRYRDVSTPALDSPQLIRHLESRYQRQAFEWAGKLFPVTVLWTNEDDLVHPDAVLGNLNYAEPMRWTETAVLSQSDYAEALEFIKAEYTAGPIKHEGVDYRMTSIQGTTGIPTIEGAFGYYYDNILTQYALEWELKKALLEGATPSDLGVGGRLPLRESVERYGNPVLRGDSRCAAITISTLTVFRRETGRFSCLIWKRSASVGVSPGLLHVVPSGMFEADNLDDPWSVETNVWRELLEEVYDEPEERGTGTARLSEHQKLKPPVPMLLDMLQRGTAELSVTGVCCDLLNLRPEICTVLFVSDPSFVSARGMQVGWEYELQAQSGGRFAVPLDKVEDLIAADVRKTGMVPSGAVSLGLGRSWIRRRHGI